ncbi:cysteine--tRNA ligase [Candidatus Parvarchaeota archaeon]|jgi:cysteinyl-tRNA synthetase|nr:cysteine--tRNA ligase [Candidatus Parvarchaeota archaeon]
MEIYNTLSKKVENFKALKEGLVTMYTCGPTVYNYVHIGNLRTFIFYDMVKRAFKFNDYKVKHVMNITDVDDKTIKGAIESRVSLKEYTELYTKYFMEDLEKLNVDMDIKFTKATDNIDEMQKIIAKLLKEGYAYEAEDGIYFSVSKFKDYGKLSGMKVNGDYSRIKTDEYDKDNAADFALWKYWDTNDGKVHWEGKLKKGRPGWHIECSAMSMKYLGKTIDIHCGAVDLIFPHHENEIAQSESYSKQKFVDYWLHGEHLLVNNQKMSKSLNNFYTLRDLEKQGFNPLSFRLMVIDSHYRNKLDFNFENLRKYEKLLGKIDLSIKALNKTKKYDEKEDSYSRIQTKQKVDNELQAFKEAVNNDLNTHEALQHFLSLLDLADEKTEKGKIDNKEFSALSNAISKMNGFLGVYIDYEIPQEMIALAEEREKKRKDKDFVAADLLRQRISENGYFIADLPNTFVITKKYLD